MKPIQTCTMARTNNETITGMSVNWQHRGGDAVDDERSQTEIKISRAPLRNRDVKPRHRMQPKSQRNMTETIGPESERRINESRATIPMSP